MTKQLVVSPLIVALSIHRHDNDTLSRLFSIWVGFT